MQLWKWRKTGPRPVQASTAKRAFVALSLAGTVAFSATTAAKAQTLTGAGATFPAPLYQRWFQEYGRSHGGLQINYQAIGSGGGIKAVTAHSVDFGASDAPLTNEEMRAAPGILHIPTVAGAVALAYHLPGPGPSRSGLKLSGNVIADIYLGKITRWNDPRITALNPGMKLPAAGIVPFHRSDGSGTTNVFTTYLAAVSPASKATIGIGKSVRWPKGPGGKGNTGVAALIQQTPGGFGYVELNYAAANHIPYASVRNAKGKFITPDAASTTAAASGFRVSPDLRMSIVNTSSPNGYPIASFTYLLVYPNAKPQLKGLLQWALGDGQKEAVPLAYAPLPPSVRAKALAAVRNIH